MDGEKYTRPLPYTKNSRQMRKAGHEEVLFPREEYTNLSSSANQSVLKQIYK